MSKFLRLGKYVPVVVIVLIIIYLNSLFTKHYLLGGIQIPYGSLSNEKTASAEPTYQRENATFVTLARNQELYDLAESIKLVEDRFNHKYHYDWVFFNDEPFTDEFKELTTNLVSGKTSYATIKKEHWSLPDWIDNEKLEESRKLKVNYGDSVPYRHMCRFNSGFFWKEPALDNYKYYWRVEPGIKFYCDINFDVFKFMAEKKLKYGFTVSLFEVPDTIKTFWAKVKTFISENPQYLPENNLKNFITDENGDYNRCHFWSNFEVADLDFWRGEAYSKFFDYLDKEGGFFYERWGDAPVHSVAAALFLEKSEVYHFDVIGYYHNPIGVCPTRKEDRVKNKCTCKPESNFSWKDWGCTKKFYDAANIRKPEGWEEQSH